MSNSRNCALVRQRRSVFDAAWRERLVAEWAASPHDHDAAIMHRYQKRIDALPSRAREDLLTRLLDLRAENPRSTD